MAASKASKTEEVTPDEDPKPKKAVKKAEKKSTRNWGFRPKEA